MPRCIDADALIAELQKKPIHDGHFIHTRDVSDAIFYAHTLSPDEVRGVGKWITDRTWEHDGEPYCSVCDFEQSFARFQKFKFCPNCGAKMKGVEDGTTD